MALLFPPQEELVSRKLSWSETASSAVASAFNLFFNQRPGPVIRLFLPDGTPDPGSPEEPSWIQMLSPDILVDDIFPYLLIDELLRLRKTCKAFYLLTHEVVIWKRYLRRLRIPIALSRPTFQYESRISNYEIETIVVTACALDRAWRAGFPRLQHECMLTAQCQVVDMVLLPGGKFLVASIKDRSNFRFFIMVYALDVMNGSRMIARVPTLYKAFDLQARYLRYDERMGIMIYFTRRRFARGVPRNPRDNINNFHHRVRYPTDDRMIYEAICMHVRLDSVEQLIVPEFKPTATGLYQNYASHAKKLPAPFVDVLRYTDACEIHTPSLCRANNDPVLLFVEDTIRGSEILIHNLDKGHGGHARMGCKDYPGFEGLPHRIRAMRYLPEQRGIFVIRSVRVTPQSADNIFCEIYELPPAGAFLMRAYLYWDFQDKWDIGEMSISDDAADFTGNTQYHPDFVNHRYQPPRTVWVFGSSKRQKGVVYFYLRAIKDEMGRWRYSEVLAEPRIHYNARFHEKALPGSLRTLIIEADERGSKVWLNRLRRFALSEDRFPDITKTGEENDGEDADQDPTNLLTPMTDYRRDAHRTVVDILSSNDLARVVNKYGGLVASAWDEMSGKICLATEDENSIRVLDIAPIVEPHLRLAYRWHSDLVDPNVEYPGYYIPVWPNPLNRKEPPVIPMTEPARSRRSARVKVKVEDTTPEPQAGPSTQPDVDMVYKGPAFDGPMWLPPKIEAFFCLSPKFSSQLTIS